MSASPKGAGWRQPADALAAERDCGADGVDVLLRLAERDGEAMVELHQLFGTPLFSYALRILEDRSDAEEALQDAFVRIWEKAREFDLSRGRPFTWCCALLRCCCLDKLRRRNALKRGGGGKIIRLDADVVPEAVAGIASEVRTQAIWHEQIDQVRRALASLHPLERRYIEQAIFSGRTHSEISDGGNEPLGTVKSRIRRGMIKLRKKLRDPANKPSP